MTSSSQPTSGVPQVPGAGREPANLGDILERILDRGLMIAGDIQVNLLDIELLTIKLRLLIVSVETARELGIDWWKDDPWLSTGNRDLRAENEQLRKRIATLERADDRRSIEAGGVPDKRPANVADREGGRERA